MAKIYLKFEGIDELVACDVQLNNGLLKTTDIANLLMEKNSDGKFDKMKDTIKGKFVVSQKERKQNGGEQNIDIRGKNLTGIVLGKGIRQLSKAFPEAGNKSPFQHVKGIAISPAVKDSYIGFPGGDWKSWENLDSNSKNRLPKNKDAVKGIQYDKNIDGEITKNFRRTPETSKVNSANETQQLDNSDLENALDFSNFAGKLGGFDVADFFRQQKNNIQHDTATQQKNPATKVSPETQAPQPPEDGDSSIGQDSISNKTDKKIVQDLENELNNPEISIESDEINSLQSELENNLSEEMNEVDNLLDQTNEPLNKTDTTNPEIESGQSDVDKITDAINNNDALDDPVLAQELADLMQEQSNSDIAPDNDTNEFLTDNTLKDGLNDNNPEVETTTQDLINDLENLSDDDLAEVLDDVDDLAQNEIKQDGHKSQNTVLEPKYTKITITQDNDHDNQTQNIANNSTHSQNTVENTPIGTNSHAQTLDNSVRSHIKTENLEQDRANKRVVGKIGGVMKLDQDKQEVFFESLKSKGYTLTDKGNGEVEINIPEGGIIDFDKDVSDTLEDMGIDFDSKEFKQKVTMQVDDADKKIEDISKQENSPDKYYNDVKFACKNTGDEQKQAIKNSLDRDLFMKGARSKTNDKLDTEKSHKKAEFEKDILGQGNKNISTQSNRVQTQLNKAKNQQQQINQSKSRSNVNSKKLSDMVDVK